jgi:hypothetical protein
MNEFTVTPAVGTIVVCPAPVCKTKIDVPIAKAAEAFKGIVKLFAEAEFISTTFPASVKSKVYDELAVVVATVKFGDVSVAPEIVGELIVGEVNVLFVRVWVDVVPTTLPDTP